MVMPGSDLSSRTGAHEGFRFSPSGHPTFFTYRANSASFSGMQMGKKRFRPRSHGGRGTGTGYGGGGGGYYQGSNNGQGNGRMRRRRHYQDRQDRPPPF